MRAFAVVLPMVLCACATERAASSGADGDDAKTGPATTKAGALGLQGQDTVLMMEQARRLAQSMAAAQSTAGVTCDPVATRPVGLEEERAVGKRLVTPLLKQEGPLLGPRHAAVATWVAGVGQYLAQRSSRPQLTWTFGVIENPRPFTTSTLGGYVFVSTGLLARLKNEAQLAGMLAHEMAHVTLKHGVASYNGALQKQCQAAVTAQAVLASDPTAQALVPADTRDALRLFSGLEPDGSFDSAANEGAFTQQLVSAVWLIDSARGHDAPDEAAADLDAAHLLAFSGYDAREFETFLVELGDLRGHPPSADRAQRIKALREGELRDFSHATFKPDVTARVRALRSPP